MKRRLRWWTQAGRLDRFVLVFTFLWTALHVHLHRWEAALPWAACTITWALLMGAQVDNQILRIRVRQLEHTHREWIREDLRRRGTARRHVRRGGA